MLDWPYRNYEDVKKLKEEKMKDVVPEIGEYQMVKEFGMGFYDLDERTAQIFCLIKMIEDLDYQRKLKQKG